MAGNRLMSMDTRIEGGCCCGRVRYVATSRPLASMVCHCRSCRRVAAAPMVPWVTFERDAFRFERGVPVAFQSSEGVRRSFCPACGTPLTYETDKRPGETDVTTCSLHDPEALPPTHHSWTSHDLEWLRTINDLPAFPQSRLSGD
jgi:hypothetical protein